MTHAWMIRLCLVAAVVHGFALPTYAYQHELRVPLMGCSQFFVAAGSARYQVSRNIPRQRDREELTIDIRHVPLPPGTVLVAYVGDERIGQIKLDKWQSGSLKLTAESRRMIPPLDSGSTVILKTLQGKLVMW